MTEEISTVGKGNVEEVERFDLQVSVSSANG